MIKVMIHSAGGWNRKATDGIWIQTGVPKFMRRISGELCPELSGVIAMTNNRVDGWITLMPVEGLTTGA